MQRDGFSRACVLGVPNPMAPWELRIGRLRVFYDVSVGPPSVVRVLAVGVKDRNILRIGGAEIQL